jgi:hypothetical protein
VIFLIDASILTLKHLPELAPLFNTVNEDVFDNATAVVLPYINDAPIRLGAAILSSENY